MTTSTDQAMPTRGEDASFNVTTLKIHFDTIAENQQTLISNSFRNVDRILADLKLYTDTRLESADRRYAERYEASQLALQAALIAQEKAVNTALLAAKEAVNAALTAAKEAVTKAETANEKRFDGVNEFRATLADQQSLLMPRNEVVVIIKSINDRLDTQDKEIVSLRESRSVVAGADASGQRFLTTTLALAGLVLGVVLFLVGHYLR